MIDLSLLEPYFPIILRVLLIPFVFWILSLMIRFFRFLFDDPPLIELPVDEKKIISSEINESISDGSFDIDFASERWADFYEKKMEQD